MHESRTPTLWIVVPVFDRREMVLRFTEQMLAQTFSAFTLVIVDHGTTALEASEFEDSRIVVLRESPDLWWTGAVNAGLRYVLTESTCEQDRVLIINDDVTFDTDYLQALNDAARSHPHTIVGSVCIASDTSRVLFAGVSLSRIRAQFVPRYRDCRVDALPDELIPSDVLPGRGMLVPLEAFRRIGLFDERHLPHYAADNEFAWRARKHGFYVAVCPRCIVATEPRKPPVVTSSTTLRDYMCNERKSGNLPTVAAFASLCFGRPYGLYYTGFTSARCLLSYVKRSLMRLCRAEVT